MNQLEHGQYVSRSQIDEAPFVPPKSLSREQRAQLVDELRARERWTTKAGGIRPGIR